MTLKDELQALDPDALLLAYLNAGGGIEEGRSSVIEYAEPLMQDYPPLGNFAMRMIEQGIFADNKTFLAAAAGATIALRAIMEVAEHPDTPLQLPDK